MKCKVVDNGHVIGFMTETNQFTPLRKPVPLNSVKDDGLKVVELGNSINADMSILPQLKRTGFVFKQDAERTDDVEKYDWKRTFTMRFETLFEFNSTVLSLWSCAMQLNHLFIKQQKQQKYQQKVK